VHHSLFIIHLCLGYGGLGVRLITPLNLLPKLSKCGIFTSSPTHTFVTHTAATLLTFTVCSVAALSGINVTVKTANLYSTCSFSVTLRDVHEDPIGCDIKTKGTSPTAAGVFQMASDKPQALQSNE
jgi:hypothetical protein